MNTGLGNAGVRSSKSVRGPAGPVAAANNGLTLDTATGTIAQLGQDIAAVGNPAVLLNDREIPMNGFDFRMRNGANQQFLIDPTTGNYKIGDISFGVAGTSIEIVDGAGQVIRLNATNELIGADPNTGKKYLYVDHFFGKHYQFGDINAAANQMFLDINSTNQRLQVFSGGLAASFLELNVPVGLYSIGDINNAANHCLLQVDDANKAIYGILDGSAQLSMSLVTGIYMFGDVNTVTNGTFLKIDDTTQAVTIESNGNGGLEIDFNLFGTGIAAFLGDYFVSQNGCFLDINDGANTIALRGKIGGVAGNNVFSFDGGTETVTIGDINGGGNGTKVEVVDTTEIISLISAGGAGVGGIKTNAPSATGAGLWLLGKKVAAAVAFDATQYVEVMIDGVVYKLALAA